MYKLLVFIMILTACDKFQGDTGLSGPPGPKGETGERAHKLLVNTTRATSSECPYGGYVMITYRDIDDSDSITDADVLVSSNTVCNGEKGDASNIPGPQGTQGVAGTNGHSAVFSSIAATNTQCPSGGTVVLMGTDTNDNLVLDNADSNIQTMVVCNGNSPAPNPFLPVGLVNPCGDAPGIYDEVFIRMQDGSMIASFSDNINGYNTRFSILVPANYQTSDGDNCYFTVDNSNNIINENHHY